LVLLAQFYEPKPCTKVEVRRLAATYDNKRSERPIERGSLKILRADFDMIAIVENLGTSTPLPRARRVSALWPVAAMSMRCRHI